jgi:hypothetical protein
MAIRLSAFLPLILLTMTVAVAGGIRDGSLSASSNGSTIVVRWTSDDETSVTGFIIERKAGMDGPFVQLAALSTRGNGAAYEYVDNSAFRTTDTIYQYRITAVGTSAVYYVSVRHIVNDVKRTWGSIKAMFR